MLNCRTPNNLLQFFLLFCAICFFRNIFSAIRITLINVMKTEYYYSTYFTTSNTRLLNYSFTVIGTEESTEYPPQFQLQPLNQPLKKTQRVVRTLEGARQEGCEKFPRVFTFQPPLSTFQDPSPLLVLLEKPDKAMPVL